MVLLFRVSHGTCTTCGSIRDDPVPNQTMDLLASRDCLNGLLDYVERCKRPVGRAARILARVLRYLVNYFAYLPIVLTVNATVEDSILVKEGKRNVFLALL